MSKGLTKGDLLAAQGRARRADQARGRRKPAHETAKAAIDKLEKIIAEREPHRAGRLRSRHRVRRLAAARRPRSRSPAWAEERAKKDAERKPGYQDRDLPARRRRPEAVREGLRPDARSRGVPARASARAAAPEPRIAPWLATLLGVKHGREDRRGADRQDARRLVRRRRRSRTRSSALSLLQNGDDGAAQGVEGSVHPGGAADAGRSSRPRRRRPTRATASCCWSRRCTSTRCRQVLGGQLAPDANSTLRITYGTVKSFKPGLEGSGGRAVHRRRRRSSRRTPARSRSTRRPRCSRRSRRRSSARTPIRGSAASCRSTSSRDLDITAATRARRRSTTRASWSAWRSTARSTASPRTWCSTPRRTRTIHVDARYMIWTMDSLDGADHLIKEMGLEPKLP